MNTQAGHVTSPTMLVIKALLGQTPLDILNDAIKI
jgi:hypothetical protein